MTDASTREDSATQPGYKQVAGRWVKVGPPTDAEMRRLEPEIARQEKRAAEWRSSRSPMDLCHLPQGNGHAVDVQTLVPADEQGNTERRPEPTTTRLEYPCTDLGNAERLVADHGAELRYCAAWSRWLTWTGQRWQPDETGEIYRRAKVTARAIYHEAAETEDGDQRKRLAMWARQSESKVRLDAMIALAQSEEPIAVRPADFDADGWLLNVQNGVLDLQTGQLRPHDPADMLSKVAPVDYDPQAGSEAWDQHITRFLPEPDVRRQVQRDLGRSLVGATLDEVLQVWYGTGANAKTTTSRVLRHVLGDYADRAAPDLLIESKYERHPTEVADLCGKRLVFSIEIGQGKHLAEVVVKELTGGDAKKARFMRGDFFTFEQTFSIVLIVNHKPIITGSDDGIWRRIRLIPWMYRIPDAEKQPQEEVVSRLVAGGSAVLNWLFGGLRDWQADRNWIAGEVRAVGDAYRAEMDVLAEFVEDRCLLGTGLAVRVGQLHANYEEWCQRNHEKPITKRTLTQRLRGRGISDGKGSGGTRMYLGIGLKVADSGTSSVLSHEGTKAKNYTEEVPLSATLSETCSICGALVERYGADGTAFCEAHAPAEVSQ